jgi:hypothetical protein
MDEPIFFEGEELLFFKNGIFMPERVPTCADERDEILLRTKLMVFEEQKELSTLRAKVANFDATLNYSKTGPSRKSIPDDVKLLVWARDGGACVQCGSQEELHFDHIIPVAKGGGNDHANIQILCSTCNLRKSDKIAIS